MYPNPVPMVFHPPTLDTRLHAAILDNESEKCVGMATLIQIPLCFQNGNPMFQTLIKCSTFTAAGCTMHASIYCENNSTWTHY